MGTMNTKDTKPKEFWVQEDDNQLLTASWCELKTHEQQFHMIEHSAYDSLKREAEKLVEALETYAMTNETFPEYGDVARKAIADYKKFKEGL